MWKNSTYNTIGGIIRLGLGLISIPLLIRNLGTENYGLYATSNAIINIALFSEWALAASITVYHSKDISSITKKHTLFKVNNLSVPAIYVIIVSLLTTTLVYFSIDWLTFFFNNLNVSEKSLLISIVQIGSFIISVRLFSQFFIGLLQANKAYGITNIFSTLHTVASTLLILYVSFTSKDLLLIQLLQLVTAVIMFFLYFIYCLHLGYLSHSFFTKSTSNSFTHFVKYGSRMLVAAFGTTLFSQFDRLIILRLFGLEWAGIYSASTSIANQINIVSSMPIQPLLPVLSEFSQKISNNILIEEIIIKAFAINASIILICLSGLAFFSPELVNFIFKASTLGPDLIRKCLLVIAITYSIYSFNAVGYFSLLALGSERFVTTIVLTSGGLALCAIYILSVKFGVVAGCIGNIGYSLTLLLNFRCMKKLNITSHKLLKGVYLPMIVTLFIHCISYTFNSFYLNIILFLSLLSFLLFTVKQLIGIKSV
ncbi:oligosaccharide flippase family protein [Spirosoma horti]